MARRMVRKNKLRVLAEKILMTFFTLLQNFISVGSFLLVVFCMLWFVHSVVSNDAEKMYLSLAGVVTFAVLNRLS